MAVSSLAARAAAAALLVLATLPALAQSPTRTRLVTASPSPAGQPVTMTVEVDTYAGGPPTGAVAFADNGTRLGYASLSVLGAGQATLATGGHHTCALSANGGVKCWGYNARGQLGDGTQVDRLIPVWVSGLSAGVVALTAGANHTCALTNRGAVMCWGHNHFGQLGDGTVADSSIPAPVVGLSSGVVAIGAGRQHTCAVISDGAIKCWGDNASGQLGNGSTVRSLTPSLLGGPATVYSAVAAGERHSCALTAAGGVKCWGDNSNSALGIGVGPPLLRLLPVAVSGLTSGVAAVTVGGFHTCALTTTGALKCWGYNFWGALGDGTIIIRASPVQVSGLTSGVVAVDAGRLSTCALLSSGEALCWGTIAYSPVNAPGIPYAATPQPIPQLGGTGVSISAGAFQVCAELATRAIRCWGDNSYGQIGDGTRWGGPIPKNTSAFWGVLRGRARLAATLAAGSHPLRAYFPGDAAHAPSVSPIVTHTVQ